MPKTPSSSTMRKGLVARGALDGGCFAGVGSSSLMGFTSPSMHWGKSEIVWPRYAAREFPVYPLRKRPSSTSFSEETESSARAASARNGVRGDRPRRPGVYAPVQLRAAFIASRISARPCHPAALRLGREALAQRPPATQLLGAGQSSVPISSSPLGNVKMRVFLPGPASSTC